MSKKSMISRLFNGLRQSFTSQQQEAKFIGTDRLGNKYYEKDAAKDKRGARWFVTKDGLGETMDFQIERVPDVPLEWDTWLRGGRKNPPTQEEIDANMKRSLKTVARATKLHQQAAHDKEENLESKSSQSTPKPPSINFPEYKDYEMNPGQEKKPPS